MNCAWVPDIMSAQLTEAGRNMLKIVLGPFMLLISYNERGSQVWETGRECGPIFIVTPPGVTISLCVISVSQM